MYLVSSNSKSNNPRMEDLTPFLQPSAPDYLSRAVYFRESFQMLHDFTSRFGNCDTWWKLEFALKKLTLGKFPDWHENTPRSKARVDVLNLYRIRPELFGVDLETFTLFITNAV